MMKADLNRFGASARHLRQSREICEVHDNKDQPSPLQNLKPDSGTLLPGAFLNLATPLAFLALGFIFADNKLKELRNCWWFSLGTQVTPTRFLAVAFGNRRGAEKNVM